MQCTITGTPYTIFGYKGKQVRDNIHSRDLVSAFDEFYRSPRRAEVYNIGGSRYCNCSILEAIAVSEEIAGRKLTHTYEPQNRMGDHIWYVSDVSKFKHHYPHWDYAYDLRKILEEIHVAQTQRFRRATS
jgi:CDP-paratose 2-epimerase